MRAIRWASYRRPNLLRLRRLGGWQGSVKIADVSDDPLPEDLLDAFEDDPSLTLNDSPLPPAMLEVRQTSEYVVLLAGGDKSTQHRDITCAKALARAL